jgi:hypothetical protein
MPALAFLAVVGLMLIASLFFSDAALERLAQATVANDRYGSIQADASVPVSAPHMTSQGVLAAQPNEPPALDVPTKIEPAARAARAEVRPTKQITHTQYRQNNASSHREFGLSGLN